MGDPRGGAVVCNNRCGCCRCTALSSVSVVGDDHIEDNMGDEHKKCLCGEHCGCNPCTCSKSEIITARALCKCGAACTCAS